MTTDMDASVEAAISPEDRCKSLIALAGAVKAVPPGVASRYLANGYRQIGHGG
jgi:hypothetical protein